jgi:hypothetical protein
MKPPVENGIHNFIGDQQMKQNNDYGDYGASGNEEQMMGAGGSNFNKMMDPVQIGE